MHPIMGAGLADISAVPVANDVSHYYNLQKCQLCQLSRLQVPGSCWYRKWNEDVVVWTC